MSGIEADRKTVARRHTGRAFHAQRMPSCWASLVRADLLSALPKMILPSPWDVAVAFEHSLFTPFAGATLSQHLIASLGRPVRLSAGSRGRHSHRVVDGWFAPFR